MSTNSPRSAWPKPSWMASYSPGVDRMSRVSSRPSMSSTEMSIAVGCPWRVMTTRSCVRATSETYSDRWSFASLSGTMVATAPE